MPCLWLESARDCCAYFPERLITTCMRGVRMADAKVCSDSLLSIIREEYPQIADEARAVLCRPFSMTAVDGSHKNNQEEE